MLQSEKPLIQVVEKDIYSVAGATLTEAQIIIYKEYLAKCNQDAKRKLTPEEIVEYKKNILNILATEERNAKSAKTISENPSIQLSLKNTELVLKHLVEEGKITTTWKGVTTGGMLYYRRNLEGSKS